MKTKLDYVFKGVKLDVNIPSDLNEPKKKDRFEGSVGITGDIEIHTEMEGSLLDTFMTHLLFNRIMNLLVKLSK